MVVILPAWAWGVKNPPWSKLPDGTLVIVTDPTRGGGYGDGTPLTCFLAGRVYEGKVEEWKAV